MRKQLFILFVLTVLQFRISAQTDSLSRKKLTYVCLTSGAIYTTGISLLGLTWYSQHRRSSFHFFDDSHEWLLMDKMGHAFSAYHLNRFIFSSLRWSNLAKPKALAWSALPAFLWISSVELFDGFSEAYGASASDLAANAFGISLFAVQELVWQQQRITPKISAHFSAYAAYRPNLLGGNKIERLLKDYNAQTIWLSINYRSFFKKSNFPKWLNIAIGYSADGMLGGIENPTEINGQMLPNFPRKRQFFLSLDLDLSKIQTRSKTLRTILNAINFIKIPFPTIEYSNGIFYGHVLYF